MDVAAAAVLRRRCLLFAYSSRVCARQPTPFARHDTSNHTPDGRRQLSTSAPPKQNTAALAPPSNPCLPGCMRAFSPRD
jgi:hypothetical protein